MVTTNASNEPTAASGKVLQGQGVGTASNFSTATYPSIATGTGTILRADGTNWVATTSTYPNTNAVSTLLYASSANVMAALATANNGTLVTSNTGVPSILAGPGTTGNILQSNAAAAPSFSTATYPSTTGANTMMISTSANVVTTTSFVAATTFTPVLAFGGASVGITYSTQYGKYQRVGNCITFAIYLVLTSKGSSTGSATISGLPVAAANDTGNYSFFLDIVTGGAAASTYFQGNLAVTATTLGIFYSNSTTGVITALTDGGFNNTTTVRVSGSYFV